MEKAEQGGIEHDARHGYVLDTLRDTIRQRDAAKAASRPAGQMKEVMLLSMEELKQEGESDLQHGKASSAARAKATAAPGARSKSEKKKEPPATASNSRLAVFASEEDESEDEGEDEDDQGKGAKGGSPRIPRLPRLSPVGVESAASPQA
ncbi:unnamed protein product, partial [Ectocarpus sp. 8 AP-2014]